MLLRCTRKSKSRLVCCWRLLLYMHLHQRSGAFATVLNVKGMWNSVKLYYLYYLKPYPRPGFSDSKVVKLGV